MKDAYFVDTNIFLRYLVNDDPIKAKAVLNVFKQASTNDVTLITTEAIITEIVYVLQSSKHYDLTPREIRARLHPLLMLNGLLLTHRATYLRALDLFTQLAMDFEDCLILAHMERQQINKLYSYDRGFDQIEEIERVEPAMASDVE